MLKIPGNAYTTFARIFNFPGSEGLEGIQQEVVPTQDLSRLLQYSRVKFTEYNLHIEPAVTLDSTFQWNDASDFATVSVDGIVTTNDDDLPQPLDVRILTGVYLNLEDTVADYTRAAMFRIDTTASHFMPFLEWGALATGLSQPAQIGPNKLPQILDHFGNETTAGVEVVLSGADATFDFIFTMISAEPGVLHPYPGV